MKKVISIIVLFSIILGCNNDDDQQKESQLQFNQISGYIQKGPFLNGTTVSLSELDKELKQTGRAFSSQVIDNSGNFTFEDLSLESSTVILNANGFYYDEVAGRNSNASLSLSAIVDLENKEQINVNLLTHLQKGRIESLLNDGISFQKATDSAQTELLNVFGITDKAISQSDQLNMFIDSNDNAILIALSVILQGRKDVSDFSEFLANINLDFKDDGQIQNEALKTELYKNAQDLYPDGIEANLNERYEALGFGSEVPDFQRIIAEFLITKIPFEIEYEVRNVSCQGLEDGAIDLHITGDNGPYKFNWSNSAESQNLTNIPSGTYSVWISDKYSNAINVKEIFVGVPERLTVNSTSTATDLNASNGNINLTVIGGTLPYTFSWSNNETTEDIQGLEKGIYTVTVTDASGCAIQQEVVIQEKIELVLEVLDTPCFDASNGSLDLTINGGLAPYTILWSNQETSEDLENIASGIYGVTVTDALGYTKTGELELISRPEIILESQINRPTPGMNDGSISLVITGGASPYQYQWKNGFNGSQLSNLASGEYEVTVTDANSCSIVRSIKVYGEFVDSRDGKSYKTIQVGAQTWFAENLQSTADNMGNSINYYCFNFQSSECETKGHYYPFEDAQKACPFGWRMPVENDWQELELYLGMPANEIETEGADRTNVAPRLKVGGDSLLDIALNGALFVLMDGTPNGFISMDEQSIFYSNTKVNSEEARIRSLDYNTDGVYRSILYSSQFATCLRCVKE